MADQSQGFRGKIRNLLGKQSPISEEATQNTVLIPIPKLPSILNKTSVSVAEDTLPEKDPEKEAAQKALERTIKDTAESYSPKVESRLYDVYCQYNSISPKSDPGPTFSWSKFMENNAIPNTEQRNILRSIDRETRKIPYYDPSKKNAAQELLSLSFSSPRYPKTLADVKQDEPPKPYNAQPLLRTSKDRMTAYLFLLPPVNGGEDIDPLDVLHFLKMHSIVFGLDEEKVFTACSSHQYLKLIAVANGQPAVHGQDGIIYDHFKRSLEIVLTEQENSIIDYKDLGWLQTVFEGDVICDILPPTEGVAGTTVLGQNLPGRSGKKAKVPAGPNTRVTEDQTALVSILDGVVTFISQRFKVDPLLIIKGDIGTSTGNLDVIGDVLIYGDVREGFSVTATGNIAVQGMIEGALIKSGGNVQVGCGINGNSTGKVEANGDVLSKFLESANISAKGRIVCDTAVNSKLQSDDSIQVISGRGSIIGGHLTALYGITAKTIGNTSNNRSTDIVLGNTTAFLDELRELEEKRDILQADVEKKEKDISYLSSVDEALSLENTKKLDELRLGLSMQKMQQANLRRLLNTMMEGAADPAQCYLHASTIYPPSSITIGFTNKILDKVHHSASICFKDNDIHISSM